MVVCAEQGFRLPEPRESGKVTPGPQQQSTCETPSFHQFVKVH